MLTPLLYSFRRNTTSHRVTLQLTARWWRWRANVPRPERSSARSKASVARSRSNSAMPSWTLSMRTLLVTPALRYPRLLSTTTHRPYWPSCLCTVAASRYLQAPPRRSASHLPSIRQEQTTATATATRRRLLLPPLRSVRPGYTRCNFRQNCTIDCCNHSASWQASKQASKQTNLATALLRAAVEVEEEEVAVSMARVRSRPLLQAAAPQYTFVSRFFATPQRSH